MGSNVSGLSPYDSGTGGSRPREAKAIETPEVDTKVVTEADNKAVVKPSVKSPAKSTRKRGS